MSIALVSAARNEGLYLLEWIAWHRMIGFDPIMVYNNGSTDHSTDILSRLAAIGAVEHILWVPPKGRSPQQSAYADALSRLGRGWVAFFDLDEYLLLHRDRTVEQLVKRVAGDAAGIALSWQVFGSGGAERWSPLPSIERFTRCGPPRWIENSRIKSIVRAERVKRMAIHAALVDGYYVNDAGQQVTLLRQASVRPRSTVNAQLNHYVVRSREEYAAKIARGRGSLPLRKGMPGSRPDPAAFFAEYDRNDVVDARMLPHVSALKLEMERLRRAADIPPEMMSLSRPQSD